MTDRIYDVEYLEVGDTFEGGPIDQSYFISAVLAAGGMIKLDGNRVTISELPKKAKAEVPLEVKLEKAVELIKEYNEEITKAPVEEYPIADLAAEEAVIEPTPTPKRTYKKKVN